MSDMDKLERIYTVPLGDAYRSVRNKRAPKAVKILREFLTKHMKADEVLLSEALNKFIWERSIQKPPRRVKVRVIKEDATARAYLADEKIEPKKEKKAEAPKEEKPKDEKKAEVKESPKKEEKAEAPKKEDTPKSKETSKDEKEAKEQKK
jgi:large subunit ribosomal protein L31e